jgi:hypothetical protein
MKIRKQVYDLTIDDLTHNPVWEFALDEEGDEGGDEATVRPRSVDGAVDPSAGMLIISATFTLNDGSTRSGYLTPPFQGDSSLGALQPVVVTDQGQIGFWHGVIAPTPEQIAVAYERLQSNAERTFPIRFQANLPTTEELIAGTIDGFYVLEDFSTGLTTTVC